jgi:hypothetical protein
MKEQKHLIQINISPLRRRNLPRSNRKKKKVIKAFLNHLPLMPNLNSGLKALTLK